LRETVKIAVVETEGKTGSIFEKGCIAVYDDCAAAGDWVELSRFENTVWEAKGIAEIRTVLREVVKKLDGVKVAAASEISGVAFSIFEAAGFEVFIADGVVKNVLDSVKKELLEPPETKRKEPKFDVSQFVENGMNNGDFCINMQEVLAKNAQLTSKSLLVPYLKAGKFMRLDVTCGHVPPWFDRDLPSMGLKYEVVNILPDKKTVRIVHI
jgi:Fe-only nitrogenase accessory protein AnfO